MDVGFGSILKRGSSRTIFVPSRLSRRRTPPRFSDFFWGSIGPLDFRRTGAKRTTGSALHRANPRSQGDSREPRPRFRTRQRPEMSPLRQALPKEALNFCTDDFGPLEVEYDYDAIARVFTREAIVESRPHNMWRYRELLPIDGEPTVGRRSAAPPWSGPTGWRRPWASASFTSRTTPSTIPPLSFKDRVVAVALSKAVELGLPDRRLRLDREPRRIASPPTRRRRGWRPTS